MYAETTSTVMCILFLSEVEKRADPKYKTANLPSDQRSNLYKW